MRYLKKTLFSQRMTEENELKVLMVVKTISWHPCSWSLQYHPRFVNTLRVCLGELQMVWTFGTMDGYPFCQAVGAAWRKNTLDENCFTDWQPQININNHEIIWSWTRKGELVYHLVRFQSPHYHRLHSRKVATSHPHKTFKPPVIWGITNILTKHLFWN